MVDTDPPVTNERPIRVFILDDHELVRRGLTDLLTTTDDLIIVGEAATAADALHRIPAAAPDVALLDGRLPDGSGIDVCREIRSSYENVRCLILTSYDDDEALFAAVMAGASGYLLKDIGREALVRAIDDAAHGRQVIDDRLVPAAESRIRNVALAPQECRVLALVVDGKTNKEIAAALELSERTVKHYLSNACVKLGVTRRSQAAVLFARQQTKP